MPTFDITSGKIAKAQKVLIYGVEGIGKSTLAAQAPSPLFIDIEGGTAHLDVRRLPQPTTWTMLLEEVKYVLNAPEACGGTLVIDTLDWAQTLCIRHVCTKNAKDSIEDWGYGKGYTLVYEEYGMFLNMLTEAVERGLNVICLAHSVITKFETPEENGSFDRYSLKLQAGNKTNIAKMCMEWADAVLFLNYKTIVTDVNEKTGKGKGQGGQVRKLYTTHTAAWDAKNRWGLADELTLDYKHIAPYLASHKSFNQAHTIPDHPEKPKAAEVAAEPVATAVPKGATVEADVARERAIKELDEALAATDMTREQFLAVLAAKGSITAATPFEVIPTKVIKWGAGNAAKIKSYTEKRNL